MHNEQKQCRIIACMNQKGGVGKTMTAVNLAVGLANHGYRVLLADCDPQGSATLCMGWARPDDMEGEVLMHEQFNSYRASVERKGKFNPTVLTHTEEIDGKTVTVDVIPANVELEQTEISLYFPSMAIDNRFILRKLLRTHYADYDFIVIDSRPSLGMLFINVLNASTELIVPVVPDRTSSAGLEQLFTSVQSTRQDGNPELDIIGILPTLVSGNTVIAKMTMDAITGAFDEVPVLPSVPMATKARESNALGVSLFSYCPKEKVTRAYAQVVEGVLSYYGLTKED